MLNRSGDGHALPLEHGTEEEVRAERGRRLHFGPNAWMESDILESLGDRVDVLGVAAEAAAIPPAVAELQPRIAEDGDEPVVEPYLAGEGAFDRIDSRLRHVGPDAQNIRKIGHGDGRHDGLPVASTIALVTRRAAARSNCSSEA